MKFKLIQNLVKKSQYCSISTVNGDNTPHTSPIGSVYLNNESEGYFIEMFTTSFNDKVGKTASIMAINTSPIFWLKSLFLGRFATPPGVRLKVTLLEKRKITEKERLQFYKKVRIFKYFKGYSILWSKPNLVRPFVIDEVIPVSLGAMTKHLGKES